MSDQCTRQGCKRPVINVIMLYGTLQGEDVMQKFPVCAKHNKKAVVMSSMINILDLTPTEKARFFQAWIQRKGRAE